MMIGSTQKRVTRFKKFRRTSVGINVIKKWRTSLLHNNDKWSRVVVRESSIKHSKTTRKLYEVKGDMMMWGKVTTR